MFTSLSDRFDGFYPFFVQVSPKSHALLRLRIFSADDGPCCHADYVKAKRAAWMMGIE